MGCFFVSFLFVKVSKTLNETLNLFFTIVSMANSSTKSPKWIEQCKKKAMLISSPGRENYVINSIFAKIKINIDGHVERKVSIILVGKNSQKY